MTTRDQTEQDTTRPPDLPIVARATMPATGEAVRPLPAPALPPTEPYQPRHHRRNLAWAPLFMPPALLIFGAFTFIPFLRSIQPSLFVPARAGPPARFNGVAYYLRILDLDGSG